MPTTKFFQVATSGRTIDGREITPAQIDQMAKNYDPKRYGARVWMEHLRSYLPDGPFKAYGDVLAVKADTDAAGNRVLLAQIDATPDLVQLSSDRQKVFWSIELDPNFAGSGEAYMVGLAVTDSPASLGTEMLTFALASDKTKDEVKAHLFSAFAEAALEVEEHKETGPGLLDRVKDMLAGKNKGDTARFAIVDQAVTEVAKEVAALKAAMPSTDGFAKADAVKALADQVTALSTQLAELTAKLNITPATPPRPQTSGVDANKTDC